MRKGRVLVNEILAGVIIEDQNGYTFHYDQGYLKDPEAIPVSLTLPLQSSPFTSQILFPFFDGLIPEGWLLLITERNWKIHPSDRMGLLLTVCEDCIGTVSIQRDE